MSFQARARKGREIHFGRKSNAQTKISQEESPDEAIKTVPMLLADGQKPAPSLRGAQAEEGHRIHTRLRRAATARPARHLEKKWVRACASLPFGPEFPLILVRRANRRAEALMLEGLLQPMHLLIILVIAIFVFGPKRLPELGKSLGEGIRAFKEGTHDAQTKLAAPPEASKDTAPENKN